MLSRRKHDAERRQGRFGLGVPNRRTCAVNGIDPVAYISDVLTRLAACRAEDRIEGLLPFNWKVSSQPSEDESRLHSRIRLGLADRIRRSG